MRLHVLVAALLAAACAVNPATGRRELSLVSESQEIAIGRQGAEETLRTLHEVPDTAVRQYVRSVAMGLVGVAERPDLPWSFFVLDDAAVNAFAFPGGYIFITRGILTHHLADRGGLRRRSEPGVGSPVPQVRPRR
jgi:predicted Zn-dependent protease